MSLVVDEPGFVRITINCRSRSIPAGEALELAKLKGRVLPTAPRGKTSALDLTLNSVCGLMGESWWDQLAALDGALTVGVRGGPGCLDRKSVLLSGRLRGVEILRGDLGLGRSLLRV